VHKETNQVNNPKVRKMLLQGHFVWINI